MNSSDAGFPRSASFRQMIGYGIGECANSLVMNGIFGFAMLFYTKALGLRPEWAGLAMAVSIFWEALSEPAMGHISDNTRSRWGRRHPYMVIGGLLMALCSYLIWAVPDGLRSSQTAIFWYLVAMNLVLRTGLTMFFIPYLALGFEICSDYQGRSRLQGIRSIFNMAANFAGPAMAWTFFFEDKNGVQATTVAANYQWMGGVFAVATAFFAMVVILVTFHWHEDTRQVQLRAKERGLIGFFRDMKQIILDPYPRWVFVFTTIVGIGMALVACLQMFVYDDFMRFSGVEKSFAHGGSMIGFAVGAAVGVGLARRFDKKGAVLLGCLLSVFCNLALGLIFLPGWVSPHAVWHTGGLHLPISLILFVIFHAGYWMGSGILVPISTAMMADVAEIHLLRTGENKDGGYSSIFSLAMRLATSFSLIVSGWCLSWIGYRTAVGTETVAQTPQALWNLGAVTFVVGALISALASASIWKYPVTRGFLEEMRRRSGERNLDAPATQAA
jgi:GPH family glycoside/pentoside/hexuronide:cation symporter